MVNPPHSAGINGMPAERGAQKKVERCRIGCGFAEDAAKSSRIGQCRLESTHLGGRCGLFLHRPKKHTDTT